MCKFHQDVALDVARNADGSFDPLSFNLNALTVGINFSISEYTPSMPNLSGNNILAMAEKRGQQAFSESGLVYDPHAFETYRHDTIGFLQQRTHEILAKHAIDPKIIKKIGTGSKAKVFLNNIPDEIYAPLDNLSTDIYKNRKQKELYHGLRLASAEYWNDHDTQDILKKYFEHSAASIFTHAKKQSEKWYIKPAVQAYESLPDTVKKYGDCATGICTAAGIHSITHIGCISKFAILPALGASTLAADPVVTYSVMTGLSLGGLALWKYIHNVRGTVPNKMEKFSTYGSSLVMFGIVGMLHTGHDEGGSYYYNDEAGNQYIIQRDPSCMGNERNDTILIKAAAPTL